VPGLVVLRRRERIPADRGAARGQVGAADPGDERGRPGRTLDALAGGPSPAIARIHPAAVMEGRIAPGSGVHPRPAPRLHVRPAAIAVRGPVLVDSRRVPDL